MKLRLNTVITVSAILLPILLTILISSLLRRTALVRELRALREEQAAIEKKNEELQSFIHYFSLEASREREARARLNLAKPGETLVIFVSPSPSPSPVFEENLNLMQKFFRWLRR
jgi:cell division protein FtsB